MPVSPNESALRAILILSIFSYKHASTEEHSRIKRERLRDQKGENQGQNDIKA